MTVFNNGYAQKIYEVVSPYLGDVMSKGAVISQCKKIGVSVDSLQHKDLDVLSENMGKALILFIGSENARVLVNKMKQL